MEMILIQPDIVKSSLLSWAQEEFTVHWGKRALFPGEICTYQSQEWKAGAKLSGKHPKSSCTSGYLPQWQLVLHEQSASDNSFGNKSLPAAVTCLMVASACKRFDMSVSQVHRELCQAAKCLCKRPPMANIAGKQIQSKDSLCKWGTRNFGGFII